MSKLNILKLSLLIATMSALVNAQEKLPYLNEALAPEVRVEDLMERMTIKEKVGQMCQFVGFNYLARSNKGMTAEQILNSDSQAVYKGFVTSDIADMVIAGEIGSFLHVLDPKEANQIQKLASRSRLQIPILVGIDAIHGNGMVYGCTVYPSPITMAASFSEAFAYQVGRQTALEMRATGSHWAFTPNVDVLRDPRWGRVGETFGEDTKLVGDLGVSMIKGFQLEDYTGLDVVIACAKHLIAGSEPVNGLNFSPMDISERNLREIYLKPYERAVDAGVYSMMSAHHEINGVPCVMNDYLMNTIVRDEYGFEGFFVSDWLDIERIADLHRVAKDLDEASALAVNAGTDMHMHGPDFLESVLKANQAGIIPTERIEDACRKILLAKFKLGLFENRYIDLAAVEEKIFTEAHQQTALEMARKSIILLKNDGLLPFKAKKQKILVTGPNAHNNTILGDWALVQPEENVTTIYEGIQALGESYGHRVDFHDSNQDMRSISDRDIKKAVKKAKKYDSIFLVIGDNSMRHLGEDNKVAGENVARAALDLAGNQLKLAQALYALGKPMVVVLVNGKPISEPWLYQTVPAVIEAWEPGSFGGQAVAEIIFGEVNPSGKMPLTVARSVGHLQMIYNHKPSYHRKKYAFESVEPLYVFGHGLSYSNFSYSDLKLAQEGNTKDAMIKLSVNLSNDSEVDGEEVVQVYFRDEISTITRPVKELVAYQRIFVGANTSESVEFLIPLEALSYFDADMKTVVEAGDFTFMVGGSSGDDNLIKASHVVEGNFSY
jgi:beta-glucosidase